MALSESLRKQLADLVASNGVVLFMKGTPRMPQCGFSARPRPCEIPQGRALGRLDTRVYSQEGAAQDGEWLVSGGYAVRSPWRRYP